MMYGTNIGGRRGGERIGCGRTFGVGEKEGGMEGEDKGGLMEMRML